MQWMQIRRSLSGFAFGIATLTLTMTPALCFADVQEPTEAEIPTVSKPLSLKPSDNKHVAHVTTTRANKKNVPNSNNTYFEAPAKDHIVSQYRAGHRLHRFSESMPRTWQHSVRYIEPPTPLHRLPAPIPPKARIKKGVAPTAPPLAPFRGIVAGANVVVTLTNSDTQTVTIISPITPNEHVAPFVKGSMLYLRDDKNDKLAGPARAKIKPVFVLVGANNIQTIRLEDNSSLNAQNYRSAGLHIVSASSGHAFLHGTMGVQNIEQWGTGMVSIDWVKCKTLNIFTQGPGLVRLAGHVDDLTIRAVGNGRVDAKYLRAEDASIQTTQIAEVAVTANDNLNTFASGHSYIYYYKTPNFISRRTDGSGNVLQMQYWD